MGKGGPRHVAGQGQVYNDELFLSPVMGNGYPYDEADLEWQFMELNKTQEPG